jgi:toxin ParE1/3/4
MSQCSFSRQAAQRLIDALEDRCRLLLRLPELGERCEDLAPRLRRLSVGSYILFYRPADDGIEVVRVIRGGRDIEALFRPGP